MYDGLLDKLGSRQVRPSSADGRLLIEKLGEALYHQAPSFRSKLTQRIFDKLDSRARNPPNAEKRELGNNVKAAIGMKQKRKTILLKVRIIVFPVEIAHRRTVIHLAARDAIQRVTAGTVEG